MKKDSFVIWTFLSFLLIIFAPLELFFTNKNEWWFQVIDIIGILLLLFAVAEAVGGLVIILISQHKIEKMVGILSWLSLYFYIQGTYIPCSYGVLDGKEINWKEYWYYGMASIALGITLLIAIAFLIKRWGVSRFARVMKSVSSFVILILLSTLGALYFQTNQKQNNNIAVTENNMLNFSEEKNIIVLLLDAYDSSVFSNIVDNYPEIRDELKDFTYYPDTLGAYPTTKGALPQILTGIWNENIESYEEYLSRAFTECDLYDCLESKGYDVNLYTDSTFIPENMVDRIQNVENVKYQISSKKGLVEKIFKLVGFKYMPHQFKKYFWMYSGELEQYMSISEEMGAVRSSDNIAFYNKLRNGIVVDRIEKQYKFYHLKGAHVPYTMNRYVEKVESTTAEETGLGCMEIVKEMLNQLKDSGIYDNTAIIIMADHGQISLGQNPLLLIKDFEVSKADLTVSEVPVSYEDLQPTFISLVEEEEHEDTIFDLAYENRARRFMYYQWEDADWDSGFLPIIYEYYSNGKAYDVDSLVKSGYQYENGECRQVVYTFKNGATIQVDGKEECELLFIRGISQAEKDSDGIWRTWSLGNVTTLRVDLEDSVDTDIVLSVMGTPASEDQILKVVINDEEIGIMESTENGFRIVIPKEVITSSIIEIDIQYPNAFRPVDRGINEDTRILAFRYETVIFSKNNED